MDEFKKEIVKLLAAKNFAVAESLLEVPPDHKMGDYALPCFTLSKELKKSPAQIAKDIVKSVEPNAMIVKIEAVGPYVNFFVSSEKLAEIVFEDAFKLKNDYGKSLIGRDKEVMIEYCGPNTNKPLHLGHIRNMLIKELFNRVLATKKLFSIRLA